MKKYLLLKKLALILQPELGTKLKNSILNPKPGNWRVGSHRMRETIPKEINKVSLDKTPKDEWGVPLLKYLC